MNKPTLQPFISPAPRSPIEKVQRILGCGEMLNILYNKGAITTTTYEREMENLEFDLHQLFE